MVTKSLEYASAHPAFLRAHDLISHDSSSTLAKKLFQPSPNSATPWSWYSSRFSIRGFSSFVIEVSQMLDWDTRKSSLWIFCIPFVHSMQNVSWYPSFMFVDEVIWKGAADPMLAYLLPPDIIGEHNPNLFSGFVVKHHIVSCYPPGLRQKLLPSPSMPASGYNSGVNLWSCGFIECHC